MPRTRPVVIVTRKLPDVIETRMMELFEARLNPDDHPMARRRVQDLGIRTVIDTEYHGYRIMQLHPSDTGWSFLEIDFQP